MLETGLMITLVGIGVVFAFLCVLIITMMINAKVIAFIGKYFPEEVLAPAKVVKKSSDEEIAIAIAAVKALN